MSLRAVLDTNVLVSGLGWPGPPAALLDAAFSGRIHLVTSQTLLNELRRVLGYPRLSRVLQTASVSANELVELITAISTVVAPTRRISVARDPDDNRVLEAAVTGEVDMIVTGDHPLLALREFEGVVIVTAADAHNRLLHGT